MTEELTLYVIIILESKGIIRTLDTKNIHDDEGFTRTQSLMSVKGWPELYRCSSYTTENKKSEQFKF